MATWVKNPTEIRFYRVDYGAEQSKPGKFSLLKIKITFSFHAECFRFGDLFFPLNLGLDSDWSKSESSTSALPLSERVELTLRILPRDEFQKAKPRQLILLSFVFKNWMPIFLVDPVKVFFLRKIL